MKHEVQHPSAWVIAVWLAVLTPGLAAAEPPLPAAFYAAGDEAGGSDQLYRAGRRALDEKRWGDAVRLFSESAGSGAAHADAAHYWWAYALSRDGRSAEALEVLARLRKGFANSSWLDDAGALEIEIREGGGDEASAVDGDEELKLLALNSLMHNDSERAVPMLRKLLETSGSRQLRERALFVASQSESPGATELLLEVAKGDRHRELQLKAIHYLGMSDAEAAGTALEEIYRSNADGEVKKAVLHAFMVAEAAEPLLRVARTESDVELRRAAVHQLGVMDARDALRQLYAAESAVEVKRQILHSMFIADDTEFLTKVARTESGEGLRYGAIRSLGLIGSDAAKAALAEIYGQSPGAGVREAVIEAFFLSDDVQQLIRIARTESDAQLRKAAFRRLSMMDDEAAIDFMMEVLEQ